MSDKYLVMVGKMRLEEIPFLEKHQRHDALVVGHNGTTQSEVVLLEVSTFGGFQLDSSFTDE
ncbi:unnamed protein product [Anisakis simplex]|uniref:Phage protein n=1 Tax=Anisakis simplex TaxID=6269 RepID=A0A0M3KK96_ANISI|nr:unnamed protein product [Anisakis simplex]